MPAQRFRSWLTFVACTAVVFLVAESVLHGFPPTRDRLLSSAAEVGAAALLIGAIEVFGAWRASKRGAG